MYEDTRRRSLLSRLLGFFDGLRRFLLNVLFFGLLIGLVALSFGGRPKVPADSALVLNPKGVIVEQLSAVDPVERLVSRGSGAGQASETLLKDLLDALRLAKDDARIKAVYLDTSDLAGSGFTKLRDLKDALADFRKSGKKVIAYGDSFFQPQYYLAAQADEVYLHPEGMVLIGGYGGYRQFYKEGLDKFGVEMHVFRVGEYKSAVEPYLRNDMSPEARENALDIYGDLWRGWLADVAAARKIDAASITALVDAMPERLRAAGGDMARLASDAKLVDKLSTRDEVRQRLIALTSEDKDKHTFRQVAYADYLRAKGGDRAGATGRGSAVAVVVAKGTILDGSQPAGTIGGDSTARVLRRARENDSVKAVVLRVDSPGGSSFASEVIRRECELVRKAGKPLVVSMGTVAASGGYWVSTASDEIWAEPETITGSIGIFGVFPSIHKPLAKYLGVHTDGVGTTRFTGALRPDRPLDPAAADMVQQVIDEGYRDFLARVAEARKLTTERVDQLGRGRVWSGEDAKAHGLVDQLGGLDAAIESAAKRAKLEKGYRVWYIEKEKTFREQLLEMLAASASSMIEAVAWASAPEAAHSLPDSLAARSSASPLSVAATVRRFEQQVAEVSRWNDPRGIYAHCLCGEEY
jgi:protease-4